MTFRVLDKNILFARVICTEQQAASQRGGRWGHLCESIQRCSLPTYPILMTKCWISLATSGILSQVREMQKQLTYSTMYARHFISGARLHSTVKAGLQVNITLQISEAMYNLVTVLWAELKLVQTSSGYWTTPHTNIQQMLYIELNIWKVRSIVVEFPVHTSGHIWHERDGKRFVLFLWTQYYWVLCMARSKVQRRN